MKIFSWVQNKFTSKKSNSIPHHDHIQQPCKEEFDDWPQGLLAIGTFGNKILKQELDQTAELQEDSPDDHLTTEQVGKLQKELNLMLESTLNNLETHPFDKLIDSNSNSEAEQRNNHLQCSTSLVHSRGIDMCLDNSKGAIGKKSFSFLLKKVFVCSSGFSSPPPSLRDPIMESRMEKMLRSILHKKIYPHRSTKLSNKKSLDRNISKITNGDDKKTDIDGSKWVKTDSEYIVLEI